MEINSLNSSINERLKQVRIDKSLTQKVFAKSLGIAQGFLSEIEKGKKQPSDTLLLALSYRYKINIDWLLSGEGEMYNKEGGMAPESLAKIDIKDMPLYNIKEWLDEFWTSASEEEKAWLKIEFGRLFPEYKEWLLTHHPETNSHQMLP